ncbi:MAG: NmrA family NAD(P)-binding protein [Leptospiraceae bacterium]|nr:NmrA family NAD(P)-binding protein [Leptospiraceae bacterium]
MKPMILITGATGTVGKEIVNVLIEQGIYFRATTRFLNKNYSKIDWYKLNYNSIESIKNCLVDIQILLLILPLSTIQVEMATRIIDVAYLVGVKHIIFLSSTGSKAIGGPSIGRWHRTVERYIISSGISYTIIRPTTFMQNFLTFYKIENNEICLPWSNSKICFIDVRDIAKFIHCIILNLSIHIDKTYTLTSMDNNTMNEFVEIISEVVSKRIKYKDITLEEFEQKIRSSKIISEDMIIPSLELHEYYYQGKHSSPTDDFHYITKINPISFKEFCTYYKKELINE